MGGRPLWGTTPRDSIAAACAARGAADVIAGCVRLLLEDAEPNRVGDPALVAALAGPQAVRYLDAPADQRYWLRVWGARGLLWAPVTDDPAVTAAILAALSDEHWRVREMAAKVVARHRIDDAQPAITGLFDDDHPRVRTAAARALRVLTIP